MTPRNGPAHIVVDGSNIGTEGRSMPSLKQLNEAVMSFMEEHPDAAVTVVVDATFGHRIDKKETKEFEEGISNNELVAPPAGAVGRGDAFVLGIADKAGASVLSNDSFQEFHADYEWLFDEGRLIGGKPVPHVGWVWVARTPVRGPVSRKATQGQRGGRSSSRGGRGRNRRDENEIRVGSPEASGPMPVPKSPPPNGQKTASKKSTAKQSTARQSAARQSEQPAQRAAPRGGEPVNELLPFLEFVEHHPVGTSVNATVDSYSSHGAYVTIGADGVRGYVPLRMMAEPTPRSAKSIMKVGESVTLVVVSFAGARRSIDCAVPDMADEAIATAKSEAAGDDVVVEAAMAEQTADATRSEKSAAKKPTAKKSTKTAVKKATVKRATTKKTATKKPATKKPTTKKPTAKKTAAKKVAAKKSVAKKTAAKKAPAKKAAAKKPVAKKTATATAATGTAAATKTGGVKKVAMEKTPVKKAAAPRKPVQKSGAKKAAAKKSAGAKKSAARKEG